MTTGSIHMLTAELSEELRSTYGSNGAAAMAGMQPLRDAFATFGRRAKKAHLPLEDAMAAATDALQELFDRAGGEANGPSTMLAAGISLAALSRAYHGIGEHRTTNSDEPLSRAPMPWLAALHGSTGRPRQTSNCRTRSRPASGWWPRPRAPTPAPCCLYDEATDSLALRAAVGLNAASVRSSHRAARGRDHGPAPPRKRWWLPPRTSMPTRRTGRTRRPARICIPPRSRSRCSLVTSRRLPAWLGSSTS